MMARAMTEGSGDRETCDGGKAVTKESGDKGKRRRREALTKRSSDEGSVVPLGCSDEGEGLTYGNGDFGKWCGG